MITSLFIFALCLVLSAFFSASEMAYVSANFVKFREMADSGNELAKKILGLLEKPKEFLTIILVGNNIVNITSTAIVTYWFEDKLGIANEWLMMLLMAPILIIFCETVPKDYARRRPHEILSRFSGPLTYFTAVLHPFAQWILKAVYKILGPLGAAVDRSIFISEKEFRALIEESTQSGVIDRHEKQLIDRIMDFERLKVESVMTPLDQVEKVDITETIGKVKEIARRTKAKMILVKEELPDLTVGLMYVFDILFEGNENEKFKNYLRSPVFLSKDTTIEKAFLTLQEKRQSFAVVTDERGEVIGVVPIEKLFSA